ncbi:DUF928 domain-containing protein [Arthrospira platensis]|uniref:DUF928 domain-containing protein n=1 Tax=Limnospira TaxID=2596745 RepID=UPI0001C38E68|nr:DUF928 domain-containing protein [Arthrospira platensis]AMW28616.1 hypothetical protein AP285_12175 [Arthrospira platensis YZ]KDR57612.1 hypothetical protein APPUASWS_009895 [Arthrospira platensis str. Paraca]MBD2669917.1 DUF928 domain-containing protein [Arthrospira platensis FACHB-439]MBD2712213.1 DUF928 domain-containing protein [Arthrospira platensis FACHB-835]MDF2210558.1 DUF928 domain-containing protein [Arthrospira platensis NCB002]MDT9184880.1 DUF928 domain-containing protein [Limn
MTQQFLKPFVSISLILSVGLVVQNTSPSLAQTARRNQNRPPTHVSMAFEPPPGQGMPTRTAAGGSRGSCPDVQQLSQTLTALVPNLIQPQEIGPDMRGLTVQAKPTLFFYLPALVGTEVAFSLKDEDGFDIYQTSLPIPQKPGIVSIRIPDDAPSLEAGKNYRWSFGIVCETSNAGNIPEVVFVSGEIQRIQLDNDLSQKLAIAKPLEQAAIYAQYGIWFESLATLATLRQQQPEDFTLASHWRELLNSVGLENVADEPFVEWN